MLKALAVSLLVLALFAVPALAAAYCGNSVCDPGETPASCPADCAPKNWPWRGIVIHYQYPTQNRTSYSDPSAGIAGPEDIGLLREMGVNMVTLNLDVPRAITRAKAYDKVNLSVQQAFDLNLEWANRMLDACANAGIVAHVRMHDFPLDPNDNTDKTTEQFWSNQTLLDQVVDSAGKIARNLSSRGDELQAYSIIAEPVLNLKKPPRATIPPQWPTLRQRIIDAIRTNDTNNRWIVISPGPGGQVGGYNSSVPNSLQAPLSDPKIIYNHHFYQPHIFTAQFANSDNDKWLPSTYPGTINGTAWNKAQMEEYMKPLVDFQEKYGVLVNTGEFSAIRWADGASQWTKDAIDVFDSHNFSWAFFNFKANNIWDPSFKEFTFETWKNDYAQWLADCKSGGNTTEQCWLAFIQQYRSNCKFGDYYQGTSLCWSNDYQGYNTARWAVLKEAYAKNPRCGNSVCETGETCTSCPQDCGVCPACSPGQTRACPLQLGVCSGSFETCASGSWPGCTSSNYGSAYQPTEASCDGKDNDCDGQTDEGLKLTFYQDSDSDGYGNTYSTIQACVQPSGYSSNSLDCNDSNPDVNPAAPEACNGIDDDCDSYIDESCGCIVGQSRSCSVAHQGKCSIGTETCPSGSWTGCPTPSTEICNSIDDNCNGQTDEGACGPYCGDGHCNGNEACFSCSQDCGDCPPPPPPPPTCSEGETRSCSVAYKGKCAFGTETCSGGNWSGCPAPSQEICNGIDDNCDGYTDNGISCECTPGQSVECGSDVGECSKGTQYCLDTRQWGSCMGEIKPSPEICDGKDNDCDGQIDDSCTNEPIPPIINRTLQCQNGPIPASGCYCAGSFYKTGYCYSGKFYEKNPETGTWQIIAIVVVIAIAAASIGAIMLR